MRRLGPAIERHCMGDSAVDVAAVDVAAVDVAAVDVAAVRAAFGEAMDAWQRVWPFGLGPVMRGAGRARIAFWPGRPGSAARQMRKALRTRDESLLDPGQLAGKSVAVKDLHALERLLFDVPRNAYTCGLAGAIARYQSNLAEEIVHEWTKEDGFRQAVIAAGAASDEYADDAEAARDMMRVLSESLDAIIAQKLEAPLGESVAKAKPKRAESWRSERSMRNIVANIASIRALVETSGGFADLVTAHGESELADSLRSGFADAESKARAVVEPLRDAVSVPGHGRTRWPVVVGILRAMAAATNPASCRASNPPTHSSSRPFSSLIAANSSCISALNCARVFQSVLPPSGVIVQMGPVLDGVADHMAHYGEDEAFRPADRVPVDVAAALRSARAEVLICYLPVGSEQAIRHYARACLEAGVAMVNCVPVFLASDTVWADRFRSAGLPIIGDDIKSQVGATIVHRMLGRLFADRGMKLDRTYQLNTGGNTDFLNMLERARL